VIQPITCDGALNNVFRVRVRERVIACKPCLEMPRLRLVTSFK
jgi:hypothetical protein